MSELSLPTLHAGTPEVAVVASSGIQVRALHLLRQPDAAQPMRWLAVRTVIDPLSRTGCQFGARPLKAAADAPVLADATTVQGLDGQTLRLHTVDADATLALTDSAGRALWASNAQGTVLAHAYEHDSAGGRLVEVCEQAAGDVKRQRERLDYGEPLAARRSHNLAGECVAHFDNAGVMYTHSLSLGGRALETCQQLLRPQAQQPDWAGSSEQELEPPLRVINRMDAVGARLEQVNAVGVSTRSVYDVSGAVAQTWMGQGAGETLVLKAVQRRADGVPLSQTAGNDVTDTYAYSARSQYLSRHRTYRRGDHPQGKLEISDLHYTYDPVGNILSLDDQGASPTWHRNTRADGLREYGYDTLYRLVSASGRERIQVSGIWSPAFSAADRKGGNAWSKYTEHYTYDDGDNLIVLSHNGGAGSRSRKRMVSKQSNRAMPEGHELTPETGFVPGGLQKALADGRPLSWQADNQLRQVSLVRRAEGEDDVERFHYADGGTRTRKVTTLKLAQGLQTTLVTYAGGCETRSRQLDGQLQKQVVITEHAGVRWIHSPLNGEYQLRYGFTDHLGSSSGETDALGRVVARQEYAPYGETTGSDEGSVEIDNLQQRTLRYSGKELDATGLYYYGWRYYLSAFGCWLSADPAGTVDGLNLFCMVLNNPVVRVDEQGLMYSPESLVRGMRSLMDQGRPLTPKAPAQGEPNQDESETPEEAASSSRMIEPAAETAVDRKPGKPGKKKREAKKASMQAALAHEEDNDGFSTVASRSSRGSSTSNLSRASTQPPNSPGGGQGKRYTTDPTEMVRYLSKLTMSVEEGVQVIGAGERPSPDVHGNKVFYLTKGKGMGLNHVVRRHEQDFMDAGIAMTDLPVLLLEALAAGNIVEGEGNPTRPVYQVNFKGKKHFIAISVGKRGQIVGAHPHNRFRRLQAREARLFARV
ncbi:RHS repeat-associated core domain-containing protein [Pseudomonas sp. TWI628]|uniref:RHS repeat domain-containing protein n=1 Tax=Pseudomonas sp. TWI628 TaxID=3136788 RepID=UPI00320903A6